jgi:glycosyltransferase involved in cell wall biosynthesis
VPRVSIITTCKGRLHHLRRSLPRFLAQPEAEAIVVDYDCPDRTAEVVAREFPAARVVAVTDRPNFAISEARNLGAAAAAAEWLAFIDADIVIAPDFHARLAPRLQPGAFYRFPPRGRASSLWGSCVMRRDDFLAVGRYDEAMQGYGGDDQDMYFRLALAGLQPQWLDFDLLSEVIEHDVAERIRFGARPSMLHHQRLNSAYLIVKTSLLRQLGPNGLTPEQCTTLYRLVGDVVNDANRKPDSPIHFSIELPPDPHGVSVPAWTVARHLVFDLTPTEVPPPDQA